MYLQFILNKMLFHFYFALVFTVTKNQMKDERGNAWEKLFLSRKFTAEKFDLKTA